MARGLLLFNNIEEPTPPEKQIKGRSKSLIQMRNECLLDRLFFYKKNFPWNYDYVLERLRDEFFLSEVTIPQIIEKPESQLYLRTLKLEQPNKDSFAKKWPHLKWAA
ncbi:MAG: hypothetical protein ACT4OJ_08720 [Bacteroidota bacterium]